MNKQIVSFLSLFSLVLVLSIYYVLLPSSFLPDNGDDGAVGGEIEDSVLVYFAALQVELDAKHQSIIDDANSLVSSSGDDSIIEEALKTIAQERMIIQSEKNLVTSIKNIGYPTAFSEILSSNVDIVVYSPEYKLGDNVIREVLEIYSIVFNQLKLDVERANVTFKGK